MKKSVFTSESVTRGHPDKVCDQIADRILDELLRQDPESHVACEVTCATDQVHIFGEISSDARVDYEEIARKVIAARCVSICTNSLRILRAASPRRAGKSFWTTVRETRA